MHVTHLYMDNGDTVCGAEEVYRKPDEPTKLCRKCHQIVMELTDVFSN